VAIFFMSRSALPRTRQCANGLEKWASRRSPAEIEEALRRQSRNVLERHRNSDEVIGKIVNDLVHQVSWAYAEREYKLIAEGRGRPVPGPANLLSVKVDDLLKAHGLRGNWLQLGDDEEQGTIGLVAELEAIAQTAFRGACGKQAGVMARPARITKAGKTLGKVHRNK
jgi:hypothetical protein